MKTKTVLIIGFLGGVVIGGGITLLDFAPAAVAILMKPLGWLVADLHPYPSESLENLIIAFPLMFVYWGFLGALIGLLSQAVALIFVKWRERNGQDPKT